MERTLISLSVRGLMPRFIGIKTERLWLPSKVLKMCEIQVTSGHWYEIRLSLKPVKGASTSLCRHTSQCTYIVYAHTLNIFRLVNRHNEAHPYS